MGIKAHVGARLVLTFPMILVLLTTVFFVMHVVPGDPVRAMVGEGASEEFVMKVRHDLGLDRPIYVQYLDYLSGLLRGDFGVSLIQQRTPVILLLQQSFPATVELTVVAMVFAVIVGVFSGAYASARAGTKEDHAIRGIVLFGYSMPSYVFGLLLQLIFAVYLGVLPLYGRYSPVARPIGGTGFLLVDTLITGNFKLFLDALSHIILPAIVLGTWSASTLNRITRSNMVEVFGEDFVSVAKARSLPEGLIVYRHVLRNALLPVVTLIGLEFASLLGGSVLTETIFSWPGLGNLLVIAANNRDYLVVQGIVTLYAIIVAVVTLMLDISYYVIDPRIRHE